MQHQLRWLLDGGVKLLSVILLLGATSLCAESVTRSFEGGRNPSIFIKKHRWREETWRSKSRATDILLMCIKHSVSPITIFIVALEYLSKAVHPALAA